MTGQQKIFDRHVDATCLKLENSQFGRWEVSKTPSDTVLFEILFLRRISDSVKPLNLYPEFPTYATPPTTSIVLHVNPVPAFVRHASSSSTSCSRLPTRLSSRLSPTVSLQGHQGGKGQKQHAWRLYRQLTQCSLGTNWRLQPGWHSFQTSFSGIFFEDRNH